MCSSGGLHIFIMGYEVSRSGGEQCSPAKASKTFGSA